MGDLVASIEALASALAKKFPDDYTVTLTELKTTIAELLLEWSYSGQNPISVRKAFEKSNTQVTVNFSDGSPPKKMDLHSFASYCGCLVGLRGPAFIDKCISNPNIKAVNPELTVSWAIALGTILKSIKVSTRTFMRAYADYASRGAIHNGGVGVDWCLAKDLDALCAFLAYNQVRHNPERKVDRNHKMWNAVKLTYASMSVWDSITMLQAKGNLTADAIDNSAVKAGLDNQLYRDYRREFYDALKNIKCPLDDEKAFKYGPVRQRVEMNHFK